MATLILICGLPGAGKTQLAKQMESSRQAFRLCPDEWIKAVVENESDKHELDRLREPVEALQWNTAQKLLTLGVTVVLENGFWTKEERTKLQSQAKALGVRVELHYLNVPKEQLWRRIANRNSDAPEHAFRITRKEFDSWWPLFQVPDSDELKTYDNYTE